jgi:glycogen(starch) synthase
MKRLLMTADTVGGVWTYALELARALRSHDFEVLLATMGQPVSASQRGELQTLENVHLIESAFRLEWMHEPWEDVAAAGSWLLDVRDRYQPDLVHLNGYAHGSLPWGLPVLVVGHSCVFSWWKAVHGSSPPSAWNRYREEVTRGLAYATHVVAPTHAMLQSLREIYGAFERATVIPNGRSDPRFAAAPKVPLVFSAGRLWDEAKNAAALVSVAPAVKWPISLAGQTGFVPAGKKHSVHYLGHLSSDDLAVWMSRASIFASPARYEPFGLSILEAASSGCALVLGDIESLRELWDGAALFVPPDDHAKLEKTLNELTGDPDLLQRMRSLAQERSQRFTAKRMAENYTELYSALCNSSSFITR